MKTRILAISLLVTLLAAGASSAGAGTPVSATVTLRVAPEGFAVPTHWALGNPSVWAVDPANFTQLNAASGVAGCTLTVADANDDGRIDGGEVLDAAAAVGCISGWTYEVYDCCGRFVTGVDGVQAVGWPVSWWAVQVNAKSSLGIDALSLVDGDSLEFIHVLGP